MALCQQGHRNPVTRCNAVYTAQPIAIQAGIVTNQAVTIRPAMPQRTDERRLVAPTPRIEEEMTCVVETGIPRRLAISITVAAAVSAAKPSIGRNATTRRPIVCTMRQPPIEVPSPMAVAADRITHSGTCH